MRLLLATMMLLIGLAGAGPGRAETRCPPTAASGPLSVNFLGVSTIVVRGGDDAIMIDGFFSRPNVFENPFAGLVPDATLIGDGLRRAQIGRLHALLVAQAHHDHGMDAGQVALATGAVVVGSRSTANIALGARVPRDRIVTVDNELTDCFGPFRVRVIRSPHSPGPLPALLTGWIRDPLVRSPWVFGYRDRRNFSFLISYGDRKILVHPSANHPRRGRDMGDIRADLVFLSIGDLGLQSPGYIRDYWNAVVRRSGARVVVPIHWDNFFEQFPLVARKEDHYGLPRMPLQNFDFAVRSLHDLGGECVQIRFLHAYREEPVEALLADNSRPAHCEPEIR